jgi:hypothetical protein
VITTLLKNKPLRTTALSALGAVLGISGTAVCPTVLGLVPPAAASPTTAKLDLTMTATYACPFSCAGPSGNWTSISGTAYSGVATFKVFATALVIGTSKGCDLETEEASFTQQSGPARGDAFWLTTTSSKICPSAYPNVLIATDSYAIRGGTGVFKGATGKATDWWSVLAYPQVGNGEFLASITY